MEGKPGGRLYFDVFTFYCRFRILSRGDHSFSLCKSTVTSLERTIDRTTLLCVCFASAALTPVPTRGLGRRSLLLACNGSRKRIKNLFISRLMAC